MGIVASRDQQAIIWAERQAIASPIAGELQHIPPDVNRTAGRELPDPDGVVK